MTIENNHTDTSTLNAAADAIGKNYLGFSGAGTIAAVGGKADASVNVVHATSSIATEISDLYNQSKQYAGSMLTTAAVSIPAGILVAHIDEVSGGLTAGLPVIGSMLSKLFTR